MIKILIAAGLFLLSSPALAVIYIQSSGGGGAFDPIDESPDVWYDASDNDSLWVFSDPARQTHPSAGTDNVYNVDDLSGNANHADVQFDFWHSFEPSYQNSLDAIDKTDNGNGSQIYTSFTAKSFNSITAVFVGEMLASGSTNRWAMELLDADGTSANAIQIGDGPNGETGWGFVYDSYTMQLISASGVSASTFYLIVVEIDFVNQTSKMYVDGTEIETDSTTGSGAAITGIDTLRINGQFDIFGEFLLYDGLVYTSNKSDFDSYFDTKWAIPGL